jgi:hypothetical protein
MARQIRLSPAQATLGERNTVPQNHGRTRMAKCLGCGNTFSVSIFDLSKDQLCPNCSRTAKVKSKHEDDEKLVAEEKQAQLESELTAGQVLLSTGEMGRPYQVIDVIFAIDSADQSAPNRLAGADPGAVFNKVKVQLRRQCRAHGGDAVIHCRFSHRVAAGADLPGGKQTLEIFAYGTAVKFV